MLFFWKTTMKNPFKLLNKFDIALWSASVIIIVLAFTVSPNRDYLTLVSSVTGVSALIFIVKGSVVGQILTVIFSVFYGVVSYFFAYYGEMITYLGMSAPAAVFAIISWIRHPYKDSAQVAIGKLNKTKIAVAFILTAAVTTAFYFILRALGTANLITSTVSVATSVLAASFTFLRSPLYGIAYAANDIVLIALWTLATIKDIAYIPMILCFALFLIYDIYGFFSWKKRRSQQSGSADDRHDPTDTDVQAPLPDNDFQ